MAKISISRKEARKSKYWLMLLKESGYIDPYSKKVKAPLEEVDSLTNTRTKIVKSSQYNEK